MIRSSLDDAARIHAAVTPDTLWRYLAVNIHVRAMPNTFEAMCAFLKLHKDHPANALRTAQLICTDLRWRRVTAPLIVDIEQSAILDEEALDRLADGFLWDDQLAWLVPEQWIRDGTVRLPHKRRKPGRIAVVIDRPIPPPLRRWAAARVVAGEPRTATDVLGRVNEMDSRSGDAAMAGLLDAASALPPEDRDALTELDCAWPSGAVRLRALKLLAETDEQAALRRAAHDASGTIRTWGQKRASPEDRVDRPPERRPGPAHQRSIRAPEPQPSLFE